jgi:hypothetical protein
VRFSEHYGVLLEVGRLATPRSGRSNVV